MAKRRLSRNEIRLEDRIIYGTIVVIAVVIGLAVWLFFPW
jgi:hypothetical protein